KYRRLHVITGDANCSEVATLLKVGTTALVLCLVEDEALPRTFAFRAPVAAMREVSHDLTLRRPLELDDGTTVTALEVQWELLARARAWAEAEGLDAVGGAEVGELVLREWEAVLTDLEVDPMRARDRVDWVAKQHLLQAYQDRHGVGWDDPRVAAMALQYHDLRPHRSLADRVGLRRLTSAEEVARAMTEPPSDTRAYFRGRCLQRWSSDIVAANWDSIVFDIGQSTLRRVPMMEPLRGTRSHVGTVVDESADPAELLARLSG
ncbi:MAG: proteasome accessory factor PafA2 family protein, partial [Acidimicrobiales bacterium]|nr:proteasome accessory factor PafA2 family protein [Acidimicrobiales bacterium]